MQITGFGGGLNSEGLTHFYRQFFGFTFFYNEIFENFIVKFFFIFIVKK